MLTWCVILVRAYVVLQGRQVLGWIVYVRGYFGCIVSPAPQAVYHGGCLAHVKYNNPPVLTYLYIEDCEIAAMCIWMLTSRFMVPWLMVFDLWFFLQRKFVFLWLYDPICIISP